MSIIFLNFAAEMEINAVEKTIFFNTHTTMKKVLLYAFALFCVALFATSCNNPKTTVVNVHVQLADGTPVADRLVLYTDDKAAYEKAIDPNAEKDPLWLPSDQGVMSDANGVAKVVLELEKSKNMYFLVRHPLVNMYNSSSTFVFKGFTIDLDLKIGE